MAIKASEISDLIKARIEKFASATEERNIGTVVTVTDGIVRIHGLADAKYGEMLEFPGDSFGLALNLEQDSVGAVVLGEYKHISEGDTVKTTGRILEVPVGEGLLGRVVDSLGKPIDGKGPIKAAHNSPIERVAPGVIARKSVSQPVQTGYKAVDSMVPIGRGQRELIIGDRQTGKTALAIDTIINQKSSGIKCVYVAIGQKQSSIANVVRKLEEHDAMKHTIIVAASASVPASMQYLAPYSGCAMGEYFMDRGEDALIIYDDLTKQAWAYRQMSLLLRRPPGREAYPGDVFYLHSRLLERSARVNEEYVEKKTGGKVKGKTGSLTGLPIIETQAGDVTAFVPTNVISITDGQIFLEGDLFNAGIRPAMNAGVSVSRVGGAAQTKLISKLSGGIKLSLAQYRELAAFSQFASDLDESTRKQLERGQRVTEMMKQKQYAPMSVAEMALSIYAVNNGYMDKVELKKVGAFEAGLQAFAKTNYKAQMDGLNANPVLNPENEATLKKISEEFASHRDVLKPWPGVKEIRVKIASFKSTQKITKAMQMVAASKMRKAQERMRATRPYAQRIRRVIGHLRKANPDFRHPYPGRARGEGGRLHRHHHRSRPVRRPERQPVQGDAGGDARLAGPRRAGFAVPDRLEGRAVLPPARQRQDARHRHAPRRPAARRGPDRHHQGDARPVQGRQARPRVPGAQRVHQHDEPEARDPSAAAGRHRGRGQAAEACGITSTSRPRRSCSTAC